MNRQIYRQFYVEFRRLSWKILEAKYLYYVENSPLLKDEDYDIMEKRYDFLALSLKLLPSASDMIGFDTKKPSCLLVYDKFRRKSLVNKDYKFPFYTNEELNLMARNLERK